MLVTSHGHRLLFTLERYMKLNRNEHANEGENIYASTCTELTVDVDTQQCELSAKFITTTNWLGTWRLVAYTRRTNYELLKWKSAQFQSLFCTLFWNPFKTIHCTSLFASKLRNQTKKREASKFKSVPLECISYPVPQLPSATSFLLPPVAAIYGFKFIQV